MKKWIVGLACLGMFVGAAAGELIISQYVETDSGTTPKAVELWNTGASEIDFSVTGVAILKGVNGGALAPDFSLDTGTLAAGAVMVVGSSDVVTYVDGLGTGVLTVEKGWTFNGDDALQVQLDSVVQDTFGDPGTGDPGAGWDGNGVQTYNQNIAILDSISTGDTDGWTDPSLRFETISETPSGAGGLAGFGVAPGPIGFAVTFDLGDDFIVDEGVSEVLTATAANGTGPYTYSWSSDLGGTFYAAASNTFTILDTAPTGTFSATVEATDASPATVTNVINFSVQTPAPKYAITITPATNGTVTTTPATEAEEGETVTINTTPAGGYAVDTITVTDSAMGDVPAPGGIFTMPALTVTVTVTFQVHTGSALYITEVADPNGDYGGRFVELYNSSGASIDLAAGSWTLSLQRNGGSTWSEVALTGTVAAGSTYVVAGYTNFPDLYPSAPAGTPDQTGSAAQGGGDDGYFLYSGGDRSTGVMEDAYGVLDVDGTGEPWEYQYSRAVRNTSSTAGNPTWSAGDWTITDPAVVADMTPGVYPDGPVVFRVTFDQVEGFTLDEGSSEAITATAAAGIEPYTYVWSSTLAVSNYTASNNVFTILGNVSTGGYSATVVASDDTPQSVTNTINFTVVPPPVQYGITIVTNVPANGTVTTSPETEAAEGETVTVNATANSGFRVATINVSGFGDLAGTTFTMPASAVTVTVTFEVYVAPDALVDFEDYTGGYASNDYVAAGVTWAMRSAYDGTDSVDRKFDTTAARFQHDREGVGNPAFMRSSAFAQPINKITFWYANYSGNDGGMFKVQVSDDGSTWQDVGLEYDPVLDAALVEATIDVIPASMTYVQIITTAGSADRVNIDNIGFFFGAASYGVSFDKANGFVVDEGTSDAVTATAANGVAPYSYSWSSDLGGAYYTAASNLFTIQDTAPVGSYYAEVVATDSDAPAASVTNTITFNVVTPGVSNTITITPPVNGTVTTTPSGGAMSGDTVTINASPNTGFQTDTLTVVDAATNPVAVVGTDFVMPASAVTVTVTFSAIPTGAAIVIDGSLTGNVNELLALTISLTNSATPASDWYVTLKDPTDANVWVYNPPPSFSFTPTMVGEYSLTVTAVDDSPTPVPLASTNVTLTITTPSANPVIPPITFVAGTGFTFEVPTGYSLTRVEGAVTTLSGDVFNWLTLTEGAGNDYTLVGTTVTVLDSATLPSGYGRMIRLVVELSP
jgi:Divergent InlB B-repeat domain